MRSTPLAQGDIEAAIMRICDELEEATEEFASLCDAEAEAENDYKAVLLRAWVKSADDRDPDTNKRLTEKARETKAQLASEPEGQVYRLAAARLRAGREVLASKRARLDALRTLSANARSQT